jgi:hypothetical protein
MSVRIRLRRERTPCREVARDDLLLHLGNAELEAMAVIIVLDRFDPVFPAAGLEVVEVEVVDRLLRFSESTLEIDRVLLVVEADQIEEVAVVVEDHQDVTEEEEPVRKPEGITAVREGDRVAETGELVREETDTPRRKRKVLPRRSMLVGEV